MDIKTRLLELLAATPKRNLPLDISNPIIGQTDGFTYGRLVRSQGDPSKHLLWDLHNGPDINPQVLVVSSLKPTQVAGILKDCLRAERRRLYEGYEEYKAAGDIEDWAEQTKAYMDIENEACALFKMMNKQQ